MQQVTKTYNLTGNDYYIQIASVVSFLAGKELKGRELIFLSHIMEQGFILTKAVRKNIKEAMSLKKGEAEMLAMNLSKKGYLIRNTDKLYTVIPILHLDKDKQTISLIFNRNGS